MTVPCDLLTDAVRWRFPLGDTQELQVALPTGELRLRRQDLFVAGPPGGELRVVGEYRGGGKPDGPDDTGDGFGPGWTLAQGAGPDARGRRAVLERDSDGRVTEVLDPLGARAAAFAYDADGRLVRHTDADGHDTGYRWDAEGRLAGLLLADGGTVGLAYDAAGAVAEVAWEGPQGPARVRFGYAPGRATVTDALGRVTVHAFDAEDRPLSVTGPAGEPARWTWDAHGRLTAATDATGHTTRYAHGPQGQLTELTLPTSARSTAAYDDPDHPELPTALRDPAGNTLLLAYDAQGHLVTTGAPGRAKPVDRRAYDPGHGGLLSLTDGKGDTTSFAYDADGLLTAVAPPAPLGRTVFRYDGLSRITAVTAGNGRRTGYRHDASGRLTEVRDEDSGDVLLTLVHDALGRVVRKAGADWSYDFTWVRTQAGSRLAAAVRTEGAGRDEVRLTHDAAGAPLSLTTAGGTTRYTYDAAGAPATVTGPSGRTVRFTHDAAGRLVRLDTGTAVQEIGYDASGRRTSLVVRGPDGTELLRAAYGYALPDGTDTDVLRSATVDGTTTTYAYDGLKRLVRAGDVTYSYDDAHHLVRLGSIDFTLNAAGQVVRFGETEFGYDGAGNFTDEVNPTGSFSYSPTHQTLAGVFGGQLVAEMRYDALGQEMPRRITETALDGRTVTHVFTYTPLGIGRVLDDGVPTDVVRAPDGRLLAVLTADGRHYWTVTDQQGSVLALLDDDGHVVARYRYTPHGAVSASGDAAAACPFRYRGAYQLLRSAHLLDHHFYNGFWGRFTQPAPTGLQYAPYTFADNDPVNTGTWTRHDVWAVAARGGDVRGFFPRPPGPGGPGAAVFDVTGPGVTPDRQPRVAGQPARRALSTP
ncbi:RHS repeat protein [Streptomyces sp. NPDC127039]|uniref:RHS repeat protein n=1 Tax=Streptomyces sp. NPDC127039 TaxID=3347115 RepID=UPI0036492862